MVVALLASGAPAASAATTLAPVADSYVDASAPTTNYGALAKLRTDGSPIVRSVLRFDVQGWVPGTSRATLRLTPTSSLNTGLQVLRVADTTWGERAITSATAPPLGSLVATTAPPKANQLVSVDVTSAISGNGLASLALGSPDTTAEALASREAGAATAPQLVIDNPDTAPPAPTLTGPADGATLNGATPSITGTAGTATGDEGTVTVLLWAGTDTSGAPQQSLPAAALAGGAFSVAPTTALTDGRYSVVVQQRDAAGNVGRSGTRSFTVDRPPPGPTATSPAAGATTADSTPTFSGTAGTEAGDSSSVSVRVWQGSGTSGAPLLSLDTARGTTGAFSVDSPTALADGLYSWRVDQTDAAGNTGSSPTHSFTVDTHTTPPPGPVTLAPVADSYVDASAPTTNYGALAKLRTDGSPIVRSFLRFDVQGWVPGTSRATLRLTPTSNLNTGLQVLRVADTSWGERAITSANAPPLGSLVATTAPPKANQPVSVNVTAAISGNGPASLALASPDTTAEALASRESGAATTPQLVIDNPDVTPPAPALTAPSDGALVDNPAPLLSGTAGTAPGDAPTVTVFVWDDNDTDETPLLQLPAAALVGGSFSVAPPLPDGTYTWLAEQRDAAGNVGRSATRTFTVDTEAPAPALTAPADGSSTGDSTPALAGTAGTNPNDADHVSVLVWQGSDSTAAPLLSLDAARAGSGAFSVDVPDALPDGGYTAAVRQTDAAGHTGTSAVHAFTVDTASPAPTLTEPVDASTTTDTTPTFAGTGGTAARDSANVSIQVWDGTDTSADPVATLTAAVDPATGAFSVDSADPLDGGTYTARAEQVDAAGNRGHSATSTFAVDAPDATAPKPSLTAPLAGSSTNDPTPTLAGKAGTRPGDADSVAVRVWSGTDTSATPVADLTAARGTGGAFSIDVARPLADGGYTARVEQDDAAGNHGASAEVAF